MSESIEFGLFVTKFSIIFRLQFVLTDLLLDLLFGLCMLTLVCEYTLTPLA
jgi:hypothetical protein